MSVVELRAREGNCYQMAQKAHRLWAEVTVSAHECCQLREIAHTKIGVQADELCFKKELSDAPSGRVM